MGWDVGQKDEIAYDLTSPQSGPFYEGLCIVKRSGKRGFVNQKGEVLDAGRWAYRTFSGDEWGTGEHYVYFVTQDETRFVSIKGNMEEKKGSGTAT